MGDSLNINNLSQGEREALFASVKANQGSGSNYVEIAGDTMTGTLNVPGFTATSTASLIGLVNNGIHNQVGGSVLASTASIAGAVVYNTQAGVNALAIRETALSGATIAPLSIAASTASQAVISVAGVFMSTASINVAANQTAFIIPVYHETQRVWGYIAASVGVI